jgi:hypothetical protein
VLGRQLGHPVGGDRPWAQGFGVGRSAACPYTDELEA